MHVMNDAPRVGAITLALSGDRERTKVAYNQSSTIVYPHLSPMASPS